MSASCECACERQGMAWCARFLLDDYLGYDAVTSDYYKVGGPPACPRELLPPSHWQHSSRKSGKGVQPTCTVANARNSCGTLHPVTPCQTMPSFFGSKTQSPKCWVSLGPHFHCKSYKKRALCLGQETVLTLVDLVHAPLRSSCSAPGYARAVPMPLL